MRQFLKVLLLSSIALPSFAQEGVQYKEKDFTNSAAVQGLNKITARVSSFDILKDEIKIFGNLEVKLLKCWKSPPEEKPESKALLKIWEQIPGEEKKEIFFGWMFASSPTVSALEHPVYDITVIECKNQSASE